LDSDWYFRQEQFESLRRDYLDADHALRDHGQYTDRQLRELNKEILGRLNIYTANKCLATLSFTCICTCDSLSVRANNI
jgi:hypothetical protein